MKANGLYHLAFLRLQESKIPYTTLKQAPPSWKKLNDVALTLSQINWIANVYDTLKAKGEVDSPAAVAISSFKKSHKVENGKWVKKKTKESMMEEKQIIYTSLYEAQLCHRQL